jgi:hypothetical protein
LHTIPALKGLIPMANDGPDTKYEARSTVPEGPFDKPWYSPRQAAEAYSKGEWPTIHFPPNGTTTGQRPGFFSVDFGNGRSGYRSFD